MSTVTKYMTTITGITEIQINSFPVELNFIHVTSTIPACVGGWGWGFRQGLAVS